MIEKMVVGPEKLPLLTVTIGGNSVDVTGKHPFLTPGGDVPAYLLTPGDLVWNGHKIGFVAVSKVDVTSKHGENPDVFNFLLQGTDAFEDHYVEANGIPTGDLFIQHSISGKGESLGSL